jgi:hypothetical protein
MQTSYFKTRFERYLLNISDTIDTWKDEINGLVTKYELCHRLYRGEPG